MSSDLAIRKGGHNMQKNNKAKEKGFYIKLSLRDNYRSRKFGVVLFLLLLKFGGLFNSLVRKPGTGRCQK